MTKYVYLLPRFLFMLLFLEILLRNSTVYVAHRNFVVDSNAEINIKQFL